MSVTGANLEASQAQLGRAVDKARAGEDRELAAQIRDTGERFVRQLYGAMRLTTTHELDNAAFEKPIHELSKTVGELVDILGAIHLVSVEGQIYINDVRVRMDERMDLGGKLGQTLLRYGLGGLSLHGVLDGDALRGFIEGFAEKPREDGRSRIEMQKRLMELGLEVIELQGVYRLRLSGERAEFDANDQRRIARSATLLVEASVDSLGQSRMPNPLSIRRVVTEMLEAGPGSDGLWAEAAGGDSFSAHTVRVSLVCMLIGRALRLSDEALQDLGVAGMFHDVGYAAREGAEAGVAGFAPPFERHASAGARLLLRQRGFHESKILRVLSTLEHHRVAVPEQGPPPTLFGRIVGVAEAYDTLTRRAPGAGLRPPDALARLWGQAGSRYDPVVLQALTNALGRWPAGTILDLEDGRTVQVVGTPSSSIAWDRPLTRRIDEDGEGEEVDLVVDPVEVVGWR